MKKPLLVSIVAAGMLSLASLPQAHADGGDLGAAVLGFALGASLGGAATLVYGAPPPVVYGPPVVVYGPPPVVYTPPPRVVYYGDGDRGRWQRRYPERAHDWQRARWHHDDDWQRRYHERAHDWQRARWHHDDDD